MHYILMFMDAMLYTALNLFISHVFSIVIEGLKNNEP